MARILVIGNAGGDKSALARKIAAQRCLPYFETDAKEGERVRAARLLLRV